MCRRANEPGKLAEVNLLDVLTTDKYKALADTCNGIEDKAERRSFKLKNVPVITVSGTFNNRRSESNLVKHSGLICLDLDGVQDIDKLKQDVYTLPFVAYIGKSISGTGLFAIVVIPESLAEEHKQRYAALESYFIQKFGITGTIDPQPKNVAAARYVSYDNEAYFNHNASMFDQLPKPVSKPEIKPKKSYCRSNKDNYSDYDKVWDMVDKIQDRKLDFCPEYSDYLKVAFSLANGLGENGRDAFHAVCQYNSTYNSPDADKKYNEALRHGNRTTLGTFFGMCKDFGLSAKRDVIPIYIPKKKNKGYPESWDDITPDYSDRWQLLNHLINGGMQVDAAKRFADNEPVRQLIGLGFNQITVENLI